MWALLRTLSYSIEQNINKKILTKNNVPHYLANKYWFGLILLFLIFTFGEKHLTTEGIYILAIMCFIFIATQFISFNGLARVNVTTNVVLKQSKLFFLLLIGFIIGQTITVFNILSAVLCLIGSYFILKTEMKESTNKKDSVLGVILAFSVPLLSIINSYLINYALEQNWFSADVYSLVIIVWIFIFFQFFSILTKKSTSQKETVSGKNFYWLQVSGLLSVFVNYANAVAIRQIGVINTEIISALAPLFIFIIAYLLKTEKLTLQKTIGIFISISALILSALSLS